MRYFAITFEWHTRPLFRKGRLKAARIVYSANDHRQAYELALDDGKRRFPRHKWKVIACEELTAPEVKNVP